MCSGVSRFCLFEIADKPTVCQFLLYWLLVAFRFEVFAFWRLPICISSVDSFVTACGVIISISLVLPRLMLVFMVCFLDPFFYEPLYESVCMNRSLKLIARSSAGAISNLLRLSLQVFENPCSFLFVLDRT